jgi:hypothetical protein
VSTPYLFCGRCGQRCLDDDARASDAAGWRGVYCGGCLGLLAGRDGRDRGAAREHYRRHRERGAAPGSEVSHLGE